MLASVMPNEALEHVSSVVIGEAEQVWPKILSDFERGKLKEIYQPRSKSDLSNMPLPR
jgi:radical SAM superfamily enzyme YgiQ (UPF0313 family)